MLAGVLEKLDLALHERIKRLGDFITKAAALKRLSEKQNRLASLLETKWPEMRKRLMDSGDSTGVSSLKHEFITAMQKITISGGRDYLDSISRLPAEAKQAGTQWLQQMVDRLVDDVMGMITDPA